MILHSVEITDFLSVKGTTKLLLDRTITVLLGSNDHGKSNLLKAIEHLNDDRPIKSDEVNWDASGTASLDFTFKLNKSEKEMWTPAVKKLRAELEEHDATAAQNSAEENDEPAPVAVQPPTGPGTKKPAAGTPAAKPIQAPVDDDDERATQLRAFLAKAPDDNPPEDLFLSRRGVDSDLAWNGIDFEDLPDEIYEFLSTGVPRVELIRSLTGELQDSVSAAQLNTEEYEFMQGLFFYAGLDPAQAAPLFEHNDETERRIQDASKLLDENLRRLWGQGTQLHFSLAHRSGNIEFLADDPAIKKRKARMSKRSDGVTQFFRTSIRLHARRKKHSANSYLCLFDEPGVYLHPQGQKDLIQVFEELGSESQIVYATHSLFMLNQNFPERHRLVIKDDEGTKIDAKPHRANWRFATDALGVFLTSNILFSGHVLFVEGDSDPLYLYEFFRQLNRFGEIDADANRLGIMAFSDIQNLRFLLQVFKRDDPRIQALVLFDGDEEGGKMLERVKSLCERLSVKRIQLEKGKSIEDYCFHEGSFVAALTRTLRDAKESSGEKPNFQPDFDTQVKAKWDARKNGSSSKLDKPTKVQGEVSVEPAAPDAETQKKQSKTVAQTTGRWFKDLALEMIEDEASKVALARNYILACRELEEAVLKQSGYVPVKKLCQQIAEELKLPKIATEGASGVMGS